MRTRQWIQALILVCLGLYFLDNMLTGRVALYVNTAQFGWVPWLGTVLFLAIGGVQLIDLIRAPKPAPIGIEAEDHHHEDGHDHEAHNHDQHDHADHQHDDHADHDHDHAPSWARLALVSVPLLIGLIVPAKALGSAAAQNGGISSGLSSLGNGSQVALSLDPAKRTVLDWVQAFGGAGDVQQFNGQPADLIGFVYRDIRFDGKPQFMVARFILSCCVADASAIGVTVQTTDAAKWEADSWVHITGKFTVQQISGTATPVLVADAIQPVAQPDHPYLYP